MIDITTCTKYFTEVKEFAVSISKLDNFMESINYLDTYACTRDQEVVDPGYTKCSLFKDFSPYSFEFTMKLRQPDGSYKFWFSGGLIFHQGNSSGAGFPELAVRIGNITEAGWSIYT